MKDLRVPFSTVVEAFSTLEACTEFGARFIPRSGETRFYPYREILQRAGTAAGMLQGRGLMPGDRVALILSSPVQFMEAFLGVQLAGAVPAALPPPIRWGRTAEYAERTGSMVKKIDARFLVAEEALMGPLEPILREAGGPETVLDPPSLDGSARWTPVDVDPESPAFLQFSSAAEKEPKAVIVSHRNLLYNLEMMNTLYRTFPPEEARREGVCCLPLYHVMGLVGAMYSGLFHPATVNYLAPELFIARPATWLQAISRFKAVISAAPNFAYQLCVERIRDEEMAGVDLSGWIAALNGAEQVDGEIMRRFTARFARWGLRETAMTPVYGLAEAGLAVSFQDIRERPLITEFDGPKLIGEGRAEEGTGLQLVSLGPPMKGIEVRIWDGADHAVGEGRVGRIMVRGPSVTSGYYGSPEVTERTIREGWLETGDLGFIHQGELYMTGRVKEVIVIRGRNISPREVEALMDDVTEIRKGFTVALGVPIAGLGEQLVVLAEKDEGEGPREEELARAVRDAVIGGMSLMPYRVRILEPGTLPLTPSGAISRPEALRMFLSASGE